MSPAAGNDRSAHVAVVAIGRNEGERLLRCLRSLANQAATLIYVDSGSTDGSVERARGEGARVVELDMTVAFTAARARNAGFEALGSDRDRIAFVQFVDGDCEVESGWIGKARDFLAANPEVAGVFGRRRERFPDASIYNHLCDEEWNVAPGIVRSCGGDVMLRVAAFEAAGGYRPGMISGEEPELCVRLRQRGWKIVCLGAPMTIHDAAITRFSQWWRRTLRAGHAFAEGAYLHGAPPERHAAASVRRIWMWGAAVPAGVLAATLALGPAGLATALVYPLQITRLYFKRRGVSTTPLWSAMFLVLGNFPEVIGQLRFHAYRLRGKRPELIEYK